MRRFRKINFSRKKYAIRLPIKPNKLLQWSRRNRKLQIYSLLFLLFLSVVVYSLISALFGDYITLQKSGELIKKPVTPFLNDHLNPDEYSEEEDPWEEVACKIPKLNPFDKQIEHLITTPTPNEMKCIDSERFPVLFVSTLNSTLISSERIKAEFGRWTSCCYQTLRREGRDFNRPDEGFGLSNACFPISIEDDLVKVIPPEHEFLVISCFFGNERFNQPMHKIMDMHAFVNYKPEVEERIESYYEEMGTVNRKLSRYDGGKSVLMEEDKVNVVLLGLDAVSRMNFIRTMPKTYEFLMQELSAVEMQGLNKVGENTLPAISAMLTSESDETLLSTCAKDGTFDSCPFIWKEYASSGYRTSFGEDGTDISMFNYLLKGFNSPPTDYYLRPFTVAADNLIRNQQCYGPRLSFEALLDYMKKFAFKMGHDKRYFQVIWETILTHDRLNYAHFGDDHLYSTLKWFQEGGYLNHTVFILTSDHGMRSGDIHHFIQGQIEDRLPLLYYVFPPWFEKKYSRAFENLRRNRNRLTTHFDLYEVLYDLHDLRRLYTSVVIERELDLQEFDKIGGWRRGISQFLPIPFSRDCKMADIDDHFCTCYPFQEVAVNYPEVLSAADFIVDKINEKLKGYPQCAVVMLKDVENAYLIDTGREWTQEFRLTLITSPGDALFEASVILEGSEDRNVSTVIYRASIYKHQSYCIDVKRLKPYCYCIRNQ